jgi:hypothetical protein
MVLICRAEGNVLWRKNAEALVVDNEVGLEVNGGVTKYVLMY